MRRRWMHCCALEVGSHRCGFLVRRGAFVRPERDLCRVAMLRVTCVACGSAAPALGTTDPARVTACVNAHAHRAVATDISPSRAGSKRYKQQYGSWSRRWTVWGWSEQASPRCHRHRENSLATCRTQGARSMRYHMHRHRFGRRGSRPFKAPQGESPQERERQSPASCRGVSRRSCHAQPS